MLRALLVWDPSLLLLVALLLLQELHVCVIVCYLDLNQRDDAYESAWERREEEMLMMQKTNGDVFYRNMTDRCVLAIFLVQLALASTQPCAALLTCSVSSRINARNRTNVNQRGTSTT